MAHSRISDPLLAESASTGRFSLQSLVPWLTPPAQVCQAVHPPFRLPGTPDALRPDVSFLFRMCLNPSMGLDGKSYEAAATLLGTDAATIRAVAEVETSGKAFDDSGRPRILFERHYFHRLTQGRHDKLHPDISSATAGGYGKFSAQYRKLEKAYGLDPDAALKSASWGRFQIMGTNHQSAGFASVQLFVLAMARAETEHLNAFARFVMADEAMNKALKKHQWADFAKAYNGPGYKKNDYDGKLDRAYQAQASRR
ncbi:N-acetylmuramidase family protein [Frateuria sp. STR12]|uniref:N-acetylmuramidase family protein n=1 Tax=Frateuria hangzhouensis TaxID=2995589 RepID=UPI0022608A63|nr:N-acetylmuramidase family protein [Frateuria sp. STR12]MCX7514335.1 N-acetylmuramidase family protein [Frateuria sp. STR12]